MKRERFQPACGRLQASIVLWLGCVVVGSTLAADPALELSEERRQTLDRYVEQTPLAASRSYRLMAAYLAKPTRNDVEKARVYYAFTAFHLRRPQSGEKWSSNPDELLLQGKRIGASCAGYAEVFRSLCLAGGLKAIYIRGYARKGLPLLNAAAMPGEPNHSWNAVMINRRWQLLDPSWKLFLTPPEKFIYQHFPIAATRHNIHKSPRVPQFQLQLLTRPVTWQQWCSLRGE